MQVAPEQHYRSCEWHQAWHDMAPLALTQPTASSAPTWLKVTNQTSGLLRAYSINCFEPSMLGCAASRGPQIGSNHRGCRRAREAAWGAEAS